MGVTINIVNIDSLCWHILHLCFQRTKATKRRHCRWTVYIYTLWYIYIYNFNFFRTHVYTHTHIYTHIHIHIHLYVLTDKQSDKPAIEKCCFCIIMNLNKFCNSSIQSFVDMKVLKQCQSFRKVSCFDESLQIKTRFVRFSWVKSEKKSFQFLKCVVW